MGDTRHWRGVALVGAACVLLGVGGIVLVLTGVVAADRPQWSMIVGPVGVFILGVAVLVRAVRLVLVLRRERRSAAPHGAPRRAVDRPRQAD